MRLFIRNCRDNLVSIVLYVIITLLCKPIILGIRGFLVKGVCYSIINCLIRNPSNWGLWKGSRDYCKKKVCKNKFTYLNIFSHIIGQIHSNYWRVTTSDSDPTLLTSGYGSTWKCSKWSVPLRRASPNSLCFFLGQASMSNKNDLYKKI